MGSPRVLSYDVSAMLLVEDVADRHESATLIGAQPPRLPSPGPAGGVWAVTILPRTFPPAEPS
jgi:hypothetical protein